MHALICRALALKPFQHQPRSRKMTTRPCKGFRSRGTLADGGPMSSIADANSAPFCLNHRERPAVVSCALCAEPYCAECVERSDASGSVCHSCRSAVDSAGASSAGSEHDWSNVPHPWRRYWARSFDCVVAGVFLGVALGIVLEMTGVNIDLIPDLLFGLVLLGLWVPVEGVLLSLWGTTPGKALLATRVRTKNGDALSFGIGLRRSASVWVRGMGLGLGLIQLIANIIGYRTLKSEREATWDGEYGLVVEHRPIGFLRVTSFLVAFGLLSLLVFWSATLET